MTVSSVVNHEQYTGNGVTTVFQYRFRVLSASHLIVTVMDTAENITSLVLGTDYTVTGVGVVNGGNVVLTNPLADEWQISIDRSPPAVQETDLRNQGNFFAEVHEDAFDYLTMLVQRALSIFSLALQKPSWLAKYYDAKSNRIANLANPVNAQDATTKNYVDASDAVLSQQAAANFQRTLRVPESFINLVPSLAARRNSALGFNSSGDPVPLFGMTATADLALKLASHEVGLGASLIGLSGGKTVQGFVNSIELYASDYGFTGSGDETAKWKLFCQEPRSKVLDVSIGVSGEGILSDNTNLRGIHGCGFTLTADVTGTTVSGSESHFLVAGKNSVIRDIWASGVDGQFYNGAGILVSGTSGVQLINCRSYYTSGIPIKFYKSQKCKAILCDAVSARHGGMGWLCDDIEVSSCQVNRMSHPTLNAGGGWWFAACTNVKVHDCIISDCTDVGVDFEGGNKCESYNNTLIRCRNGELAVFATGTETELQTAGIVMGHITHRDNTVYRYSYCYDRSGNQVTNSLTDTAGEMVFGGLDLVQDGPITFERNKVYVVESTGNSLFCHRSRTSNASGTARIIQNECEYETRSGKAILFYDRQDRELNNCKIKYLGSAAVVGVGELRDLRSFKSVGLDVDVDLSATVSSYVLVINNSQAVTIGKLELDSWKLRGPDGAVLLRIDQTFTPRTVILNNMDLPDFVGTDPAVWPVTIGAGKIYWKNQKLRILNTSGGDLSFATGILYQSDFDAINCHTTLMLASKKKAVYRFALKCDASDSMYLTTIDSGGAANTGLWPNPICYATFIGNSVRFNNSGSDTLSVVIELNLNSM